MEQSGVRSSHEAPRIMKHKNYIKLSKLRSKVATSKRKGLFEFLKAFYEARLNGTSLRDIPGVTITPYRCRASDNSFRQVARSR